MISYERKEKQLGDNVNLTYLLIKKNSGNAEVEWELEFFLNVNAPFDIA